MTSADRPDERLALSIVSLTLPNAGYRNVHFIDHFCQTLCSMVKEEVIARISELSDPGRKPVIIDEVPALLIRVGDQLYCIEDVCTHDGQPLTDGPVANGEITCPRHGARFDLATGAPRCMPATQPVRTFEVELRGEEIVALFPA